MQKTKDSPSGNGYLPNDVYDIVKRSMTVPCVDVIVYDKEKKAVLLGLRATPPVENVYWFPGGRLLFGETPEECAVRKVKEETDLDVQILRYVNTGNTTFIFGEKRSTVNWTGLAVVTGGNVKITPNFKGYKYVTEISDGLHPYVKEFLKQSEVFSSSEALSADFRQAYRPTIVFDEAEEERKGTIKARVRKEE